MRPMLITHAKSMAGVRGDLLKKLNRLDEARVEFERAALLTRNTRERELLLRRVPRSSAVAVAVLVVSWLRSWMAFWMRFPFVAAIWLVARHACSRSFRSGLCTRRSVTSARAIFLLGDLLHNGRESWIIRDPRVGEVNGALGTETGGVRLHRS